MLNNKLKAMIYPLNLHLIFPLIGQQNVSPPRPGVKYFYCWRRFPPWRISNRPCKVKPRTPVCMFVRACMCVFDEQHKNIFARAPPSLSASLAYDSQVQYITACTHIYLLIRLACSDIPPRYELELNLSFLYLVS